MSGWISSKIKAAENLLQQIDQQAAESLRKSDRPELSSNIPFSQTNTPFSQPNIPFSQPNIPFPQNDISEPFREPNPKSINLPKKKPSFSQLPPQKPLLSSTSTSFGTGTSSNETLDADWTELLNSPPKPTKKNTSFIPQEKTIQNKSINREKETQIEPSETNIKLNDDKKSNYSESESESGSDSDDSYDSEEERERRRERAREAIEERERLVERLKREKESLERILEEREKEQVQLVRELQVNTSETMEAVEIEKKKHNSTRMEALDRVAQLEGVNGELSKVLATTQRNLLSEVNRVTELREQIELKEVAQKELRRKMNKIQSRSGLRDEMKSLERFKLEIFDAEYSFISDKITKLKDKAKNIEEYINITKREMESHSEMEIELEKRLDQLSDRLIQKQMQVESLSSEKATLLMRIEMVSRYLDSSNQSESSFDIEAGNSQPITRQERPTGRLQFGSIIHQLDSLFTAGLVFLKRNRKAQIWAVLYLLCLHFWVMYIFMSNNSEVKEGNDGAVISLAAINRTVG